MNPAIFTGLLNNATLLLAMGVLYSILPTHQRKQSLAYELFTGLVIGAIGAAVMLSPLNLMSGIIIDTRSVVLSLSGLFFGTIPTLVAVIITVVLRTFQGGAGAATGISVIIATAAVGVAWRHLRRRWLPDGNSWLELYLFGIAVHIVMLALLLPLLWPSGMNVVRSIGITVIIIYPLGAALMGKLLAYQQSRQDAEERIRKAETGLRASEERLRTIFDHAPIGIAITNEGGRFLQANPAAEHILGYSNEELIQMDFRQITHPEDLQNSIDKFDGLVNGDYEFYQYEKRYLHRDGHVIWALLTITRGEGALIIAIIDDTTARKETEAVALDAQKMAGIGGLAAGMAHEINSPLQLVTGLSERLTRNLNAGEIDAAQFLIDVEKINKNGWRIANIVRSLLTYSRQTANEINFHQLNEIVEDTLLLIEHQLKTWSSITVSKQLAAEMPAIQCDSNGLTQVVINLLENARDAMPESGGEITIRTAYDRTAKHFTLQVHNTGRLIPQDTQARIFEPFFTTKEIGKGTGLGLSIVHGIVAAHGGEITVESAEGTGTTFSVHLPLQPPPPENNASHNPEDGRYQTS
jgi:PAS domain S-box-containing protein